MSDTKDGYNSEQSDIVSPKEEQRKITDVVLSMEADMKTALKIMSNYDLNMKLILNRVNSIYQYIEQLKKDYMEVQLSDDKLKEAIKSQPVIEVYDKPIPQMIRKADVVVPEVKQPEQSSSSDKKIPTTQRITDQNGKDLFMAEVNICDVNGNVVQKTKTNATGKWQAALKSGEYIIVATKTDPATKKKVEAKQKVSIPNVNGIFTLPVAIIKRD